LYQKINYYVFKFLTHRSFWLNLLVALLLSAFLVFAFLKTLSWLTKHGEHATVPNVVGKNTREAIQLLQSKGFDVVVQDSVYTDTLKKGTIIKQIPDGNSTVKVNRTVILTLNRFVPPLIEMPKFEDQSLYAAMMQLERSHLKLEDTVFKPSFMKGAIIEQQINGQRVPAGAKVPWGSAVTFVVGSGIENDYQLVPDMKGKSFEQAKKELDAMGIMAVPVIGGDVKDTLKAFVYKQNPETYNDMHEPVYIQPGMVMDLWLSQGRPVVDSLGVDDKKKGKKKAKSNTDSND
jgi:eukaryotic-like serine/threonine-protein kinase